MYVEIKEILSRCVVFYSSDSVTLLSSAVDFIRNFQPTKQLLPSSGKLKREVSMEEIFQVINISYIIILELYKDISKC